MHLMAMCVVMLAVISGRNGLGGEERLNVDERLKVGSGAAWQKAPERSARTPWMMTQWSGEFRSCVRSLSSWARPSAS
jgi:hypothetical protein